MLSKIRKQFSEFGIDGLLVSQPENVRYLTGFTGSSGVAIISKEKGVFLTDFRYDQQAHQQVDNFDIKVFGEGSHLLDEIINIVNEIDVTQLGIEASYMTVNDYNYLREKMKTDLISTYNIVEKLRMIKSDEEIQYLKKAAEIGDLAFEHIINYIKPGVSEIEVADELEFTMRKHGATSNSSVIIVASGVRSSLPHGVASEKIIEEGDMVTLDFGALYKGYRSDMTRTIAIGEPDKKLKEIYEIVLEALVNCTSRLKEGIKASEADALLRDFIHDKGYGEYFGHGGGHGIGLMIHEEPFLSANSPYTLKENMVITVEPGIYLPDLGGVRIEDDVIIKKSGVEIITNSPRELIIL